MEALMFDAPLLSGPLGSCGGDMFPPLPDDLEDLFTDDLLAFLHSSGGGEVAPAPQPQQALPQQPAEPLPLAHAGQASSSGVVESCGSHQSEASTPSSPRSAAWEQQAAAAPVIGGGCLAPLLNAFGCGSNVAASASAPKAIPVCTSSGPALRLVTTMTQMLGGEPAPIASLPPPSSAGATTSSAARQQSSPVVSSLGSRDSDSQESHDTAAHGRPAKQTRRAAKAVVHFSNDASSSDDDDDMDEDMMDAAPGSTSSGGKGGKVNKRKAPEVDWRSIEDPAERRRQRRLAKNRVTAARSRERKKVQWADLEMRMQAIENEKSQLRAMLEQFARENASLREQIAQLTGAPCGDSDAAAPTRTTVGMNPKGSNSTAEPAALVYIATLLLVCCFLPGDKAAMVLGSAVPLLLLAQMLQKQSSEGGLAAADVNGKLGSQMFEMLFRFLHLMKHLMSKGAETMRRAMHRMLYQRQYFTGRKALQQMSTLSCLPSIHSSMVARYLIKQEVLL